MLYWRWELSFDVKISSLFAQQYKHLHCKNKLKKVWVWVLNSFMTNTHPSFCAYVTLFSLLRKKTVIVDERQAMSLVLSLSVLVFLHHFGKFGSSAILLTSLSSADAVDLFASNNHYWPGVYLYDLFFPPFFFPILFAAVFFFLFKTSDSFLLKLFSNRTERKNSTVTNWQPM